MKFVVCGAGAWGTAMALHLAHANHRVVLIPRSEEKAHIMRERGCNCFYLPNISFPQNLIVDHSVEKYLADCDALFLACPAKGLKNLCESLQQQPQSSRVPWIISLVKGLEREHLYRPSEIVHQYFQNLKFAVLSGPTYALEFAQGKPAAMVLASNASTEMMQQAISNNNVRVYTSQDFVGIELASCLKNIYALGAGILDGLQLGDNAKAAYLTRALNEMCVLGSALGGQRATFYGLGGLGDLMATAQGTWSRNRTFGEAFAKGVPIEKLLQQYTVEGYWSLEGFYKITREKNLEVPILQELYNVIYNNTALENSVNQLMLRKLKNEF